IMEQSNAVSGMAPIIRNSTDDSISSEACS
ncbi:hypothetical protein CU661_15625, partial [Pseudomonas syringae pv. actinidifoliorum]|nr:hypothetical protein [Pseudomonas syringae pv. actinidifoliorum]